MEAMVLYMAPGLWKKVMRGIVSEAMTPGLLKKVMQGLVSEAMVLQGVVSEAVMLHMAPGL